MEAHLCKQCRKTIYREAELCIGCELAINDARRVREGPTPDRPGRRMVLNQEMAYHGNEGPHHKGSYCERLKRGFLMMQGMNID